jgi:hypothetical protein
MWVVVQAAAASYARSGGTDLPAPRYGDLFVLGVIANSFALALLALGSAAESRRRWLVRVYAVGWFVLVTIAVGLSTRIELRTDLPRRHESTMQYERNVGTFVLTDDYAWLEKQQPSLPFPFADWLARELRNPILRRLLPASVRAPIAVPQLGSTPDRPAEVPPLGNRPTRLVRSGETWQSAALPPSGGYWKIETAGDLGRNGAVLDIVAADGQRVLGSLAPSKVSGNTWRAAYVRAPREPAFLRAQVEAPAQWIAFSEPVSMSTLSYRVWRFTQQAQWLGLVAAGALVALLWLGFRDTARRGRLALPEENIADEL